MIKDIKIKVMYSMYQFPVDEERRCLSRVVKDEKALFGVMKNCHNNRREYTNRWGRENEEYISYFKVEQLKFEALIGGVCDMNHFHIQKYKQMDKPTFYDKAVKMFNEWVKECKQKHKDYLETKKTDEDREKEEQEKQEYLRLKKKYEKQYYKVNKNG